MAFKCILAIAISVMTHTFTAANTVEIKNPNSKYKYIYQFGDSISDTGNLPFLNSHCAAANLPYGQSIGRPTGRFSDGFLIIDFIAMSLSLPLLNPYLKPNASFEHGANFAVAGSTALDGSSLAPLGIQTPATNTPISVQLNWFETHLNYTCGTPTGCKERLGEALFWVGEIGGNDINYAIFKGKSYEEIVAFIPSVVDALIEAVRGVINLGAMEIMVPGDVPLGCWPVYLILYPSLDPHAYDEMGCLIKFNQISLSFNNHLKGALATIRSNFPQIRIVYIDYYATFLSILLNARKLGFDETSLLKPCCGTVERNHSNDEVITCGIDAIVCSDPSQYISWDGLHLTQEAYRRMSEIILSDILSTNKNIW